MNVVYWIRYQHHVDPFTEGYIGVTNDLPRRETQHRKSKVYTHISNRLKKGALISVLHKCSDAEEALELEKQYRPTERIGWNIACGGGFYPGRIGLSMKDRTPGFTGDARTLKQKASSAAHSLRMAGRKPMHAGKTLSASHRANLRKPKSRRPPKPKCQCPYCGLIGGVPQMKRWHFDHCKSR